MGRRSLLTLCFFLCTMTAVRAQAVQLLGAGIGLVSNQVTGSNYRPKSFNSLLLQGSYSIFVSPSWRVGASGGGTTTGDFLTLSAGGFYHFQPLDWEAASPRDSVQYRILSEWSPYVGLDLSMSRVQVKLDQSSTSNTDLVAGALVGPHLRAGTLYSWDRDIILAAEAAMTFGFSSAVSASGQGLSFQFIYLLK